ncbi:hypothetical protein TFLX_03285 [Thermoflexales bacterium]|nr:hypothetical protein TFLX_03285 [Thermoflexales bacterium]
MSEESFKGIKIGDIQNSTGVAIGPDARVEIHYHGDVLPPPLPPAEFWPRGHAYAAAPHFTGRAGERAALSDWLAHGPAVRVLRALGGFGKSALAWHWLNHDVDGTAWPAALWWNFYEERTFETFLAEALPQLGIDPRNISPRQQVNVLLSRLAQTNTLLIFDGFERALRAFGGMEAAYQGDEATGGKQEVEERDCISPLAEIFLSGCMGRTEWPGRLLLTTRLRPRVLEGHDGLLVQGVCETELTALDKADAAEFFHAVGVRGTRAELEALSETYGGHPLALRLLAGLILTDPRQPGDVAATARLDVTGDLVQRHHHVLEQAYASLSTECQRLLCYLACFRGPVAYDALCTIFNPSPRLGILGHLFKRPIQNTKSDVDLDLDAALRDLQKRGLLHAETRAATQYDLHPIVRRYAYDRLAAPDRASAHTRLRDYFAAIESPPKPKTLEDLAPVIDLYHHTVRAGQYVEAFKLFLNRLGNLDTQFGAYQLQIELLRAFFLDGEDHPPHFTDEGYQAWTLNSLANCYHTSGQPRLAVTAYEQAIAIHEKHNDKKRLNTVLGNLAAVQIQIGALRAATDNLRRKITLCREIGDEFGEAVGHQGLGHLRAYLGQWEVAEQELAEALRTFAKQNEKESQCVIWNYRALAGLLQLRASPSHPALAKSAVTSARCALKLVNKHDLGHPYPRNYVYAYWLLGATLRADGQLAEAEQHLHKALTICRDINMMEVEADILIELGRLATDEAEAERLLAAALRAGYGYVLQEADVHLELARRAQSRGQQATVRTHAQAALQLATCDGEPYVYRAACTEAQVLLGNETTK